jgi:hypothetical protein
MTLAVSVLAATMTLAEGAASPPATIQDVAWIAGHYACEALGGTAEEIWLPPRAGAMLATFRMIRDDKPSFYEIATISEENGSLMLRILHFDAALHGWEKEKNGPQQFPLVKLEKGKAYFSGFTFEAKEGGAIDEWVAIHGKDGTISEALFAYKPLVASAE